MSSEDELELLYEETKRGIDKQIDRADRISEQAHQLIRNYVLSLSAIGAILSVFGGKGSTVPSLPHLISNADDFGLAVASFMFGFISLLVALVSLILAAWDNEMVRGPGSKDLRLLSKTENSKIEAKYNLLHNGYLNWLERLSNQNHKRQRMLRAAYAFSVSAAVMLFVFAITTLGTGGSP